MSSKNSPAINKYSHSFYFQYLFDSHNSPILTKFFLVLQYMKKLRSSPLEHFLVIRVCQKCRKCKNSEKPGFWGNCGYISKMVRSIFIIFWLKNIFKYIQILCANKKKKNEWLIIGVRKRVFKWIYEMEMATNRIWISMFMKYSNIIEYSLQHWLQRVEKWLSPKFRPIKTLKHYFWWSQLYFFCPMMFNIWSFLLYDKVGKNNEGMVSK